MKESTQLTLIIIGILVVATLIIIGIVLIVKTTNEGREETCKIIESKTELMYYDWDNCGWNKDCNYKCKFINENGEIVIKEVE